MEMHNRTVLISGGTGGIGLAAAQELARMGADVIIIGRSTERCQAAAAAVQQASGQPAAFITADLSTMDGVRAAAAEFKTRHEQLDVLLNNAGGFFATRQETADRLEMTFALNHLHYFLLTHLLLEPLQAAAAANGEARIISVSSGAHRGSRGINFDDLQQQRYSGWAAYSNTKLMNLLFTYALARRLDGTGITANVLHPGFVRTNFGHNNSGLFVTMLKLSQRLMAGTPEQGARLPVYLAAAPEVRGVTGRYFEKRREARSSALSYDEGLQEQLWQISEELCGLARPAP